MKILNSNEAYAALMAGKNILCRAVGDLIDFDDLDQFPATVFAKADFEFCIKIETMELAGITFTKPLMLEDIQDGQDVYTINTHGQSIYISEFGKMTTGALRDSIRNGFAQRDEVNAKLQLQAMAKVLGRELIGDCLVVRLGDDKPKKRNTAKKTDTPVPAAANDASVSVEKKTFDSQSNIQITEQGPVTTVKETLSKDFIETDSVDEDGDLKINELQRLQVEAENLINGIDQQAEPVHEHQEHLEILLNDIALAKTPAEANAQLKYTKSWTPEQRTPVIQAINKRLVQLNPIAEIKIEETPSLMAQIQNAPDLTALDVLEIDVGSRHPDIQPKLMGYVKKRRFELENGAGPVGAPL